MFSDNVEQTIKLKEHGLKLIFWLSNITIVVFCILSFILPKKTISSEFTLPIVIIVGFLVSLVNFFLFKFHGSFKGLKSVYDKTKVDSKLSDDEKTEKRLINVVTCFSQSLSINSALNAVVGVFGFISSLYTVYPIPASYALWAYGIILNCYMWPKLSRDMSKFTKKLEAN
jgi:hypothetical protein